MILERLFISSQSGRISVLSDSSVDMIPLKIVYEQEIIGFCFLKKHNSEVFKAGIIAIEKSKRGLGLGINTIKLIKQRAMSSGAKRLIVRASGAKQVTGFFVQCGFKRAFSEEILFCNIK